MALSENIEYLESFGILDQKQLVQLCSLAGLQWPSDTDLKTSWKFVLEGKFHQGSFQVRQSYRKEHGTMLR